MDTFIVSALDSSADVHSTSTGYTRQIWNVMIKIEWKKLFSGYIWFGWYLRAGWPNDQVKPFKKSDYGLHWTHSKVARVRYWPIPLKQGRRNGEHLPEWWNKYWIRRWAKTMVLNNG